MSTVAEKRNDNRRQEKDSGKGPPILRHNSFGNGHGPNGEEGSDKPISNATLAMLLFVGAEIMFFAGLIGAFIVLRFGVLDWPPPGQPRLPVTVTGINTAILLFSGVTMFNTRRHLKDWHRKKILRGLSTSLFLGALFLAVQGVEWARLLGFGLTLRSNIYGTVFYTLIGCHALHVLGAV
ncbi:MAG: heme-copper oxidase subunit III, partial [bacterium]